MDQKLLLSKFEALEAKVKGLITEYHSMEENLALKNKENSDLRKEIYTQREEIKNFQNQLKISKIVKSIAEGTQDSIGLKLKINEYIKEIDKCIAHLSE